MVALLYGARLTFGLAARFFTPYYIYVRAFPCACGLLLLFPLPPFCVSSAFFSCSPGLGRAVAPPWPGVFPTLAARTPLLGGCVIPFAVRHYALVLFQPRFCAFPDNLRPFSRQLPTLFPPGIVPFRPMPLPPSPCFSLRSAPPVSVNGRCAHSCPFCRFCPLRACRKPYFVIKREKSACFPIFFPKMFGACRYLYYLCIRLQEMTLVTRMKRVL